MSVIVGREVFLAALIPSLLLLACGSGAELRNIHTFSAADNPCSRYGCQGTFLAGVGWEDSRGENAFIITVESKESGDGTEYTLSPARYVMLGDKPKVSWQGRYSAKNMCDEEEGIIGDIEVTDLDEDGVAEVLYVYNVRGNCDVSPKEYGLLFHVGTDLYEITGTDDLQVNRGIPGNGEMTFSESFDSAPEGFRQHAQDVWNRLVPRD